MNFKHYFVIYFSKFIPFEYLIGTIPCNKVDIFFMSLFLISVLLYHLTYSFFTFHVNIKYKWGNTVLDPIWSVFSAKAHFEVPRAKVSETVPCVCWTLDIWLDKRKVRLEIWNIYYNYQIKIMIRRQYIDYRRRDTKLLFDICPLCHFLNTWLSGPF